jgi:hypothetical protein
VSYKNGETYPTSFCADFQPLYDRAIDTGRQQQALYNFPHSCGKQANNQATNQRTNEEKKNASVYFSVDYSNID